MNYSNQTTMTKRENNQPCENTPLEKDNNRITYNNNNDYSIDDEEGNSKLNIDPR